MGSLVTIAVTSRFGVVLMLQDVDVARNSSPQALTVPLLPQMTEPQRLMRLLRQPLFQQLLPPPLFLRNMLVPAAPGSHATSRGIHQTCAVLSGVIVVQLLAIVMLSHFGVALMQLAAAVGVILGGVSVVKHSEL